MREKEMKNFYYIETEKESCIVKAKNMQEAVFKYAGKHNEKFLSEITNTLHYCSYLLFIPKTDFFQEKRELIRARTIIYKS